MTRLIKIYYDQKNTFCNLEKVILNASYYTKEEKDKLLMVINYLNENNYLLYAIECLDEKNFDFKEFDKIKQYIISEVYDELIRQLLDKYKDYDEITYKEMREWFLGMTFDIELINRLDSLFKHYDVEIRY